MMDKVEIFINAIKSNNKPEIIKLISQGVDVRYSEVDRKGYISLDMPLKYACGYADVETVQLLMTHGADIKTTDGACLIWAAGKGKNDIVDFLFEQRVKPNDGGSSALSIAAFITDIEKRERTVKNLIVNHGVRLSHEDRNTLEQPCKHPFNTAIKVRALKLINSVQLHCDLNRHLIPKQTARSKIKKI